MLAWRFVPSANEFGMAAREGRVRQLDRFIVDEMEVLWVSIAESIVSLEIGHKLKLGCKLIDSSIPPTYSPSS